MSTTITASNMLSFLVGENRFQVRAAAIFLVDGHVLVHRVVTDDFWALPGGRVEFGESAQQTLVREMREELAEDVACGDLLYLAENFFEYNGQQNHEIGMYYRATFQPGSRMLDMSRVHLGAEGSLRLEFKWVPVASLAQTELFPAFLRESLAVPEPQFQHFVQRD